MKQFKAKIVSNKKIAPEHYVLSFNAPKIARNAKPGQFFSVRVSKGYEPLLRRPFGVHRVKGNKIEILYKVVGKATEILSKKKKGAMLDGLGPLGNGFDLETDASPVFLVAGGHGVAPILALAEKLSGHNSRFSVFIGARTKKHVVCDRDFGKLGGKVYISTDDGSRGYKGSVVSLLKKKLKSTGIIYGCGPKAMLKELAKLAGRLKIPCQVSLEEYMACGIGTCLGCSVTTRRGFRLVCKDGPVFDSKEIIWG